MKDIAVSVICNTFNHGEYIKDALEGFIMQKTTFPFEVLIHDDASTDNTAEIIREYEEKHPDIIKAVYQTENQYSKGVIISAKFQHPRAKGRYIALCEGDDYWTDPYKLQKQFDALEKHPEIDMCVHAAYRVDATTGKICGEMAPKNKDEETIIPVEQVILEGGNSYIPTASILYRKSMRENVPEFRKKLSIDYTLQINGALRGGILYIGEFMSAYRIGVSGSWNDRMAKNPEKAKKHYEIKHEMLKILDKETENRYAAAISEMLLRTETAVIVIEKRYKDLLKEPYKKIFKGYPLKKKLTILILAYLPWVVRIKRKIAKRGKE